MNGLCDRIDCEEPAALAPVVSVKPIDAPGEALIGITVEVCLGHTDTPIEAFIDDEQWALITAMFRDRGLMVPSRDSAVLNWVPVPFRSQHSRKRVD